MENDENSRAFYADNLLIRLPQNKYSAHVGPCYGRWCYLRFLLSSGTMLARTEGGICKVHTLKLFNMKKIDLFVELINVCFELNTV